MKLTHYHKAILIIFSVLMIDQLIKYWVKTTLFIGEEIRLDPVIVTQEISIEKILDYYMGKNTPERQEFIINNLVIELDTDYVPVDEGVEIEV